MKPKDRILVILGQEVTKKLEEIAYVMRKSKAATIRDLVSQEYENKKIGLITAKVNDVTKGVNDEL